MRQGRGFLLPLLGLVLGSAGNAAVAATDTPFADPWQATGLDFKFIEKRVTTEACYKTETRFLSCMSAVQQLLERSPRRLRMTLADDSSADAAGNQAHYGPLVLNETPPAQRGASLGVVAEVRARGARISVWRELYQTHASNGIDFTRLRTWLLSELVDSEHSAADAAAAINGYLSIEDAHARIMPASLLKGKQGAGTPGSAKAGSGGKYSGIGVNLDLIGNRPVVTGLTPGGPAARTGLRLNDLLLSVGGVSFDGGSLEEMLSRFKGPEGTYLDLQFQRDQALHVVRVVREEISMHNVVSSVIEGGESDWGYLHVNSFVEQKTCRDVRRELKKLIAAEVSGLILDVRNNGGGRIDQAVCVADLFLEPELVVLEMRSTRKQGRTHKMRTRFRTYTRLPLVTLVNAGTGSASEVLAGALRDHGRSLLLGERTFGKGTIQFPRPWDRTGLIVKFSTTDRYYLPSGNSVQRVGLEPDLHVPQYPGTDPDQQLVLRLEDFYPTTLSADSSQSIHHAAPEQVESMACLSKQDEVLKSRVEDTVQAGVLDYPLARAGELLSCML